MATTSSNLTAGKAMGGQGGNGTGIGKRAAGLLAGATLGLGLLAGTLLGQAHQASAARGLTVPPGYVFTYHDDDARMQAQVAVPTQVSVESMRFLEQNIQFPALAPVLDPRIWTGTCRAGGSDCLPGDDDIAPALPVAAPRGWTGSCRPGGSDCVPDEDILAAAPAVTATHGNGPADEYTQAERGGATSVASCVYAGVAGVPGEGCGPTATAGNPDWLLSDGTRPGFLDVMPGEDRALAFVAEQFTYREDDRAARPADASVTADYRWDFGNTQVAQRPAGASNSADYRWDFPAVTSAIVADQFTYREDHRASVAASATGFLPGVTGLVAYA